MTRVIVFIDGSNVIGALGRAALGYPALEPLLALVVQSDDLVAARFYGNPPPTEPWAGRWKSFMSANRHLAALDWFQGYRQRLTREEKAVDVAIVAGRTRSGSIRRSGRVSMGNTDSQWCRGNRFRVAVCPAIGPGLVCGLARGGYGVLSRGLLSPRISGMKKAAPGARLFIMELSRERCQRQASRPLMFAMSAPRHCDALIDEVMRLPLGAVHEAVRVEPFIWTFVQLP